MAGKNADTPKRRSKKASVGVFAFKAGDIIEYAASDNRLGANYDLLLRRVDVDKHAVTFKIMCLEDGYTQHVTYYIDEKYRVH